MTASAPQPSTPSLTQRILAFAGLPFLSLVTPFLFLPILARVAGADAWLAIAIGQSVGAFAALFVALGYNTVGPTMVALAAPDARTELLRRSVHARFALFLPAVIVAAVIAAVASPEANRLDGALMSVAMTLTGLSSSWFMIGLGRAGLIVRYEILPRIVATALAAAALLLLGQVTWYPALLIVATIASIAAYLLRTVGARDVLVARPGEIRSTLRRNRSAMTTEIAGGAYNSLAVTFVSITAPTAQAAAYVSGDKLYRIGQYSVSALGNALQGWVVEDDGREFPARVRRAFLLHGCLGLLGLAAFALLGPFLSGLLFGETVAIDTATALGFGVATLGIAIGTVLGRVTLVALGARREFMTSVLIGAAAGVPAILLLAGAFGAAGGAWGLAIGELTSVTCQAIFVALRWRTRP
ncbi:polysaccharide biosynthesis protein [Cryobacterium sp. BB307]|uniref:polysaccharide biosynthesis protein n=1 Tax=Cryobacterium sp. BB307 TaxID=2716317 RepID=UPI0014464B9F|nr:polysaccharide biosynthesis protein [Cryobacterium sp. BB307]